MKFSIKRSTLLKIIKVLKWGKFVAKIAALGTTVSGAVTALSGSATTGVALSAAGATTYAATKGMPTQTYEKTKHIPPGRVDKAANLLRKQEMDVASGRTKPNKMVVKNSSGGKGSIISASQPQMRSIAKMTTTSMVMRKK